MDRFSIREDTPKGTSVYTLRASDPEDTAVHYGILSDYFSVDQTTGVVVLTSELDRETDSLIHVTITATDESIFGQEPATTLLNRQITILDLNDEKPTFQHLPYIFMVKELTAVEVVLYTDIVVTDLDAGTNSDVVLSCDAETTPEACKKFFVKTEKMRESGIHKGIIILQEPLDFETSSTYIIAIKAEDQGIGQNLSSSAIVVAEVIDEQDQPPKFDRNVYMGVVVEGTAEELTIATLDVRDGDKDNPRQLIFKLTNDVRGYFKISQIHESESGSYQVVVSLSGVPVDREDANIKLNDGFYVVKIKAIELEDGQPSDASSTAEIWVKVNDTNEPPRFDKTSVNTTISENIAIGSYVPGLDFLVTDSDADENAFFDIFIVDTPGSSGIFNLSKSHGIGNEVVVVMVADNTKIDYENPDMRMITFLVVVRDSGGLSSEVSVTVTLQDANEFDPKFEKKLYKIRVPLQQLPHTLLIRLNVTDGDSGPFGDVELSHRTNSELFQLSSVGEVRVADCGNATCLDTPGQYDFVAKASNVDGRFVLATVIVIVEPTADQKPNTTFKKEVDAARLHFTNDVYNRTIRETTKAGTVVASLSAISTSTQAPIHYSIVSGAKENFVIDRTEGTITVSPGALLNANIAGYEYTIMVQAVQDDFPKPLFATTQVNIFIDDVNNSKPKFTEQSFVAYASEGVAIGDVILNLTAVDPDKNAKLEFSVTKVLEMRDHFGNLSKAANGDVPFVVNSSSGAVMVAGQLSHELLFTTIFVVTVEDMAAQTPGQTDTAEVTIITSAHSELPSVLKLPKAFVEFSIPEETEVGTLLLTLGQPRLSSNTGITFEKHLGSDLEEYFHVHPQSGEIRVNRLLDYESLPESKLVTLQVAVVYEKMLIYNTTIVLLISDINDELPVFDEEIYTVAIQENTTNLQPLVTVHATDLDNNTDFSHINYHITSGNEDEVFNIDRESGILIKSNRNTLDRERKASYNLKIVAKDNPRDPSNQRMSTAEVLIEVLDSNDNYAVFQNMPYAAVVPESAPSQYSFLTVYATDSDLGVNGEVEYSIVETWDSTGLFAVHPTEGVVYVNQSLSEKGQSMPYILTVRAQDKGHPPLSADTKVAITIGDLSAQSDTPHFIRPVQGETVYVAENEKVEAYVFQVELSDYNPFARPNKRVKFSLLDKGYGGSDKQAFRIDGDTGLITTRTKLDREETQNYTLVVVATRTGPLLHQAFRLLYVVVTDIDDNVPQFPRPMNAEPLEMKVQEEVAVGTVVGIIEAIDPDSEENAIIHYTILENGKDEHPFKIKRTDDNRGVIVVNGKIDHEQQQSYNLLIRASNSAEDSTTKKNNAYDPSNLSMVRLHINVTDIDDSPMKFLLGNEVLGVRLSVPRQSIVTTVQAVDPDVSDNPIQYHIKKITFKKKDGQVLSLANNVFILDKSAGNLKTGQSLIGYEDGTFHVVVSAFSINNPSNTAETELKVQVLHDAEMLKFVFQKSRPEVQRELRNLHRDFQSAMDIANLVSLQLVDTQLYNRDDAFGETESTSVCFQLVSERLPFSLDDAQALLDASEKPALNTFYRSYNISDVGLCESMRNSYRMTWIEIFVLVIAGLIAVGTVVSILIVYFLFKTHKDESSHYYPHIQADSQMPIYLSHESQKSQPPTIKPRKKSSSKDSICRLPYE